MANEVGSPEWFRELYEVACRADLTCDQFTSEIERLAPKEELERYRGDVLDIFEGDPFTPPFRDIRYRACLRWLEDKINE